MKHGSIIVFKHWVGQLIEDGVPDSDGYEWRIRGVANDRSDGMSPCYEPAIDQNVAAWRLRSLWGARGEICPTKKKISPLVSDSELRQREEDRRQQELCMERERERQRQENYQINPAWMTALYPDDPSLREEITRRFNEQRAAHERFLEDSGLIYRFTWTSEQAFAMLGGYRPDRHFAYSPDCILVPPLPSDP